MERWVSAEATIDPTARLGFGVVVEEDVEIAAGAEIGHHVVIRSGVRIGPGCRIGDQTVLGKRPASAANSAVTQEAPELPPLVLGEGCIVGRGVSSIGGLRWAPRSSWETWSPFGRT